MRKPDEQMRTVSHLEREIQRHQGTIDELRAQGHPCRDAERHLHELKSALELLR